jgi:hypothetical protein
MQERGKLSLEQIQAFLERSGEVEFEERNREEVYGWVNETLRQQRYGKLKRSGRGLVRSYLAKMTGLGRAQITRLVTLYQSGEEVKPKPYRRSRFARRYTREDIALLAEVDAAHEVLSRPATRKILQRTYYDFQEPEYERLAALSVAQLYRLRQSGTYRKHGVMDQATGEGGDRETAKAGTGRAAGVSASGYSPSGGSGWSERGVSHQRRGRGDAMGGIRSDRTDQRGLSAAGAESDIGAISL